MGENKQEKDIELIYSNTNIQQNVGNTLKSNFNYISQNSNLSN